MSDVGFGLLTTAMAIGGIIGTHDRTAASSGGSRSRTSCASAC